MDELEALKKVAWNVPGDIATNLFFRPLSIRITRTLSKTSVTPTQITLISFGLRIIAAALFLTAHYWLSIIAAALLYFAQVLDCVDGEVSRVKKMSSKRGGLIDYFLDRLADFIVYLSIAIGLYFVGRRDVVVMLGLFVIASNSLMTDIGRKVDDAKQRVSFDYFDYKPSWKSYLTYSGPTSVIILLVAAVLDRIFLGLVIIGVCTFLFAIARFSEAYATLRNPQREV
ncbi:MAG: CDP-alcohol phosphatidyltransferase family protein [Candidatus Bathyarchaeia archaeon]